MKYDANMSRKELLHQPDELVDLMVRMKDFVSANKVLVITMAGILAAAAVGAGLFISFKWSSQVEAGKLEEKNIFILDARPSGQVGGSSGNQAKYKTALGNYEKIIKKYSGTEVAKRALLGKGNAYYALKEYRKAIDVYQQFIKENLIDSFGPLVKNSLAYSYEALGDYDKAIKLFEEGSVGASPKMAAEQLMNAGRCSESKNDPLKASLFYRKARNLLAGAGGISSGAQAAGFNPVLSRIDRKIKRLERK